MANKLERLTVKENCDALQRSFEKNKNPVYLFIAYQECRRVNLQIADWILAYFDSVAEEILAEVSERERGTSPGTRRAGLFLNDIMHKGRGDLFNNFLADKKIAGERRRYAELKTANPELPDCNYENGVRDIISQEMATNEKTIQGHVAPVARAFSRLRSKNEEKRLERKAVDRFNELIAEAPDRQPFEILQQVECETGIKRIRINALINRRR